MRSLPLLLVPFCLLAACSEEEPARRTDTNEETDTGSASGDTGAGADDTGAVADNDGSGAADSGVEADTGPAPDTTPPAENTPCTAETVATDCAAGYGCDGQFCYTQCRDDGDCQDNFVCLLEEGSRYGVCADGGTSGVTSDYSYVAIISMASSNTSLLSHHPGPDIDNVEVLRDGAPLTSATVVQAFRRGGFLGSINDTIDFSAVTGAVDAMPAGGAGECNVDQAAADPNDPNGAFLTYYSMGDTDGFIVVSFADGTRFKTGDEIVVWELGPEWCSNEPAGAVDPYEVWLGKGDTNFGTLRGASNVRSSFCKVADSGPNGDVTRITFDPAACP